MGFDTAAFEAWLDRYGRAWEARDGEAATPLFTPDALYWWTPFEAPKRGRAEIARAWNDAVSRQSDVRFRHEVLSVDGSRGVARWQTSLTRTATGRRVRIDGILLVEMTDDGLCREFREWWHSDEALPPPPVSP
jgi:ketosteroid isomerase-like protein